MSDRTLTLICGIGLAVAFACLVASFILALLGYGETITVTVGQ